MAFEDILNSIAEQPLSDCFVCLKLKQTINEPGMPNQLYELIKKSFLKTVGWFVELISKLYELISKGVSYIIENGLAILNEIFAKLTKFTTQTKDWVSENLADSYNDIKVPIPAFDFVFGGFSIPLPANNAFNNLEEGSQYKKPQWLIQVSTFLAFIVKMMSLPLKFVTKIVSKIYDIIVEFIGVFSKTFDEMVQLIPAIIVKVAAFFAGLLNPLVDLVETSLGTIIGVFETSAEKIAEYMGIFFNWIISCITSGVASLDEALESLASLISNYTSDNKITIKLNMIGKFVFCMLKALFNIVKTLFTFGWI